MKTLDSHITQIISANEEDNLAIFVGSGVSFSSNTEQLKYPSWSDLIYEMRSELGVTQEVDFLKIAQLYFLEFGETNYYKKVVNFFPDGLEPSSVHKLIFDIEPNVVITTNWDTLLEKAIEQEGFIYSVVSSDKDLIKSGSPKKLIKMHGDFRNHNIVLKEDDYLNYSKNFPLITNYIKSVLSTHTVVFIGYSYSDINLKLISQWVKNNSDSTPAKYLITFDEDSSQEQYLANHGIACIPLKKVEFCESNVNFDELDDCSRLVRTFLSCVKKGPLGLESTKKLNSARIIYSKLEHLEHHEVVLQEQITNTLTNCTIRYSDDGLALLDLFEVEGVMTVNSNNTLREVFTSFKSFLKEDKNQQRTDANVEKISKVLRKAGIDGILISDSKFYVLNEGLYKFSIQNEFTFKYELQSNESTNLNTLSKKVFNLYQEKNYGAAFKVNNECISICRKQKLYGPMLIHINNRNVLLFHCKFGFVGSLRDTFKNTSLVDLKDQIYQFSKKHRKQNQFLYEFISGDYVHRKFFETYEHLKKVKRSAETVRNGGMVFNANAEKPSVLQRNIIDFTLGNRILTEDKVYKDALVNLLKIQIERSRAEEFYLANIYDIYTLITCFSHKEIFNEFLKDFVKKDIEFRIENGALRWLIDECYEPLVNKLPNTNTIDRSDEPLSNAISVLSITRLSETDMDKVLEGFKVVISSRTAPIEIYRKINDFIAFQYKVLDVNFKVQEFFQIIDKILLKVIEDNLGAYDSHAFMTNSISNIFGYVEVSKLSYENHSLIKRLVSAMKGYDLDKQKELIISILRPVYFISDDSNKKSIESYLEEFLRENHKTITTDAVFYLQLICESLVDANEDEVERMISNCMEEYKDGSKFSTSLESIRDAVKYIIDNNILNISSQLLDQLETIISNFSSKAKFAKF